MTELEMLKAELTRIQAENEALKNPPRKERTLTCKVSVKGALSVYGLGKFPVTLFAGQWVKLIAYIPELQKFMDAHASEFSVKGQGIVTQQQATAIVAIQDNNGGEAA